MVRSLKLNSLGTGRIVIYPRSCQNSSCNTSLRHANVGCQACSGWRVSSNPPCTPRRTEPQEIWSRQTLLGRCFEGSARGCWFRRLGQRGQQWERPGVCMLCQESFRYRCSGSDDWRGSSRKPNVSCAMSALGPSSDFPFQHPPSQPRQLISGPAGNLA